MKREFLVAIGGAAVVTATLAGCGGESSDRSATTTAEKTTTSETTTSETTAQSGAGAATVTIDGKAQDVSGTISCVNAVDNVNIAIGEGTTGIAAMVSQGDDPQVRRVGLGNVDGAILGYESGVGEGNAEATKDGNTYTITGTATGIDTSNPLQIVSKPFEIKVTCP